MERTLFATSQECSPTTRRRSVGSRRIYRFLFGLMARALVLAGALPVLAATETVINRNDSGSGSLRDAIAAASPGDTIQFSVSGTITLSSGELLLVKDVIIMGPGASQLAISGNRADRIFEISSGATVAVSGLTIENGHAVSGNSGGIANHGTLTNSAVSGNSSGYGPMTGGGIDNSGTATVIDSTVAGNRAYAGGGISNYGILTVANSTVTGNSGPYGGGIANFDKMTVTNSTIAGNSTGSSDHVNFYAGGIDNFGSTLTLKSIIVANNSGGNCTTAGDLPPLEGYISQGYNLSDDNSCFAAFTATGDLNNVVPGAGLDPGGLQDNGGATPTIALLPSSPAVDSIPSAQCTDSLGNAILSDQRGIPRPPGTACDCGAFELGLTTALSSFKARLALTTGTPSGFVLTSWFELGLASQGLQPVANVTTLRIANYTVTLPAGSWHEVSNAPNAPYGYDGIIDGTHLMLELFPLGENRYKVYAAGSPVAWTGIQNPISVSLAIGPYAGGKTVNASITPH